MFDEPQNVPIGTFTYDEYENMVQEYRERWCQNGIAVLPAATSLSFLGDRRVVYFRDFVVLESTE